MTIEQNRLFIEGRDYWLQYINLNGYAYNPTETGLRILAKNIDISIGHIRKCINIFLEN